MLRYASATRTLILGSALAGVVSAAATVVAAVALADLITAVAIDRASPSRLSLALLLAASLVKAGAVWAGEELPRRSAVRMVSQLRAALLDRIVVQDRTWTARQRPAELIQLATSGVGGLQSYAARYLPQLVLASLVPAGIVVVLAFQDGLSALIVGLTLPLVPVFMALVGLHSRDHAQRQLTALQVLGGHFLDLIGGLPTLKVFGRSRAQESGVRAAGDAYRVATMRTLRVAFLSSMVLELIATLSVALVAVTIGLRLVGGSLDLRTGLTVLLVAPEAYAALRAVGTHFHASTDGMAAAERVFAVLEEPMMAAGTGRLPGLSGLSDISVRASLHGVAMDVDIAVGAVTLLTGPSGVGKSTTLSLLAGQARPATGAVTVGGADLASVDPALWAGHVGYLVQAPYLPAGRLRDSLCALRPSASDAEVAVALWAAVADEVVAELPDELHTVLSDGARELSQGQRLRLAIARTLLSERQLLLFDEPSASLDLATETELVRRLPSALAGRTVVIASHREALLALADAVVDLSAASDTGADLVADATTVVV